MDTTIQPATLTDVCLPKVLVKENPELFTDSQINWLTKTRHKNGLAETGAVLKISRKIYLKKSIFFDWFMQQTAA
ncbi:hypothetical protein BMR07_13450 [Methylococcaceae bacterium CS1]|nr:hypothetical protein [Methyloprofundus sp.]TXK94587.1 hypothetical protein BMR10_12695 [Methylococcaceae bacterium CS4]TXK99092.1 hypothetical protein BMR11_07040 [Methylococcaceae bacterium CS5]TXL04073.1 hypothetical protein BMR07_13450 [Methylococcaceae bacterium CS1]TXL06674.1 hypothetical protein BMR09_07685 [Methylococcaceae bacterium CS3]TXL10807.1 hypothetical protein BMR08_07530 [Methylococcaceae bacterium CS2]